MTTPPLPEWAPHAAVWIGFPSAADLWEDDLAPAQREVAAFASAVHADGKGEAVWLVAADETAAAEARRLAPFTKVIVEPFGDIWLRDTSPIVLGSCEVERPSASDRCLQEFADANEHLRAGIAVVELMIEPFEPQEVDRRAGRP